jgi:hypothetical protein
MKIEISKTEWFTIWISVAIFLGAGVLAWGSLYIFFFVK